MTARVTLASVIGAHLRFHLMVLLRQPAFWGPTVVLPAMLYVFFGAGLAGDGPLALGAVVSFAVYAVGSVAFFQFGVGLAQDRASVFADWAVTLPGARWAGWIGQTLATVLFAVVAVVLILVIARLTGSHDAPPAIDATLLAACIVASVPAALMGCVLGMIVPARSAAGLAMMVFLPMAYVSGLWVPLDLLPAPVVAASQTMPLRHMADLVGTLANGARDRLLFAALVDSLRPLAFLAVDSAILITLLAFLTRRRRSTM